MTKPPWLEPVKRQVVLSRVAVKRLEAAATRTGVGFSRFLDAFLREALPFDPDDAATVVHARLERDAHDVAVFEELSDEDPGP